MPQNKPTEAELDILGVLWKRESATVREVYDVLSEHKSVAYTTILKLMQIMNQKGLVGRDTQAKTHVYHSKLLQKEAQKNSVGNLLDKIFDGSAKLLILQTLESKPISADEMKEIRKILKQSEKHLKKEGSSKKKDKRK